MVRIAFLAVAFAAACMAAPSAEPADWTPELADFYQSVAQQADLQRRNSWPAATTCDLSKAKQPIAPTPLPSPDGLTLVLVTIGRGTQNYTCASNSAADKPASIGAFATFYDASCTAANQPELLAKLPGVALSVPKDSPVYTRLNMIAAVHHYFAGTTPVFSFDINPQQYPYGTVFASKTASSNAPADANAGRQGEAYGAVAWLDLGTTSATVGPIRGVYRLNTAGGSPPATCEGQPTNIAIDYAAEYWFYT